MSLKVEKLEKGMAKLTIEVPAERFEEALKAAYKKEVKNINLPGFRKGKAPMKMIEKMYGVEVFYEEAANIMGASRVQIFFRVIIPEILPSLIAGFTMAFARCIGEYGSVVFIAGNTPYQTEITPLLIMSELQEYDYASATSIALIMLFIAFVILSFVSGL